MADRPTTLQGSAGEDAGGWGEPVPGSCSPPSIPLDKQMTELCASYRFFVDLRHKVFQLYVAGNAALLAAFWVMRTNLEFKNPSGFLVAGLFIRLSGVAVCIVGFLVMRHVGRIATQYQDRSSQAAVLAACQPLILPPSKSDSRIESALLILTGILILAWTVGFIFSEIPAWGRPVPAAQPA